jgi:predicted RNA-binding Zn ribbon-like protein
MDEPLCLEFANTVRWHASATPRETLHSYADLLGWAQQKGPITAQDAERLAQLAGSYAARAAAVYERAVALREAIYRIFAAHAHEGAGAAGELTLLNGELGEALAHARLAPGEVAYAWAWAGEGENLDAPLWPIVRSAAELLTAPALLERVGQCADDRGCGWLFLDLSKNHSRRWCDINDCGNRAKQRRHYARARSTA